MSGTFWQVQKSRPVPPIYVFLLSSRDEYLTFHIPHGELVHVGEPVVLPLLSEGDLNAGENSIHHFLYVLETYQKLFRKSEKLNFAIQLFFI
jgi:hypothetical protein